MLNASVKELENQVFTFHSIVAPAEKLRILLLSAMTTRMKARYINSKTKKSFDPNQRIIESWNCSDGYN
jgi:F0F1-type ATP synthase delta subunit